MFVLPLFFHGILLARAFTLTFAFFDLKSEVSMNFPLPVLNFFRADLIFRPPSSTMTGPLFCGLLRDGPKRVGCSFATPKYDHEKIRGDSKLVCEHVSSLHCMHFQIVHKILHSDGYLFCTHKTCLSTYIRHINRLLKIYLFFYYVGIQVVFFT